jgi:hypothetical protein
MTSDSPPALTLTDKLSWAAFSVFILLWMLAGVVLAIYIQVTYRGGEVTAGSGQWSQVVLYLLGMFGGTAAGLLLTRFLSHCLVPMETQRRWLGALQEALEDPYVQMRGPNVVRLFIWAAVPDRHAL